MANRCAAAAREFLEPLQVDVRVATDASAQRDCAPVAGVGIVLIAENDALARGAERDAASMEGDASPEALGEGAARALVAEVKSGGCVDAATQPLLLTLMACGADDASSCVLGPLTARAISQLRLVKKFLGVTFRLAQEEGVVRATCLGAGLRNASKGVS
jgi:RNA 3'-terminal phosphate cyclase-like protein